MKPYLFPVMLQRQRQRLVSNDGRESLVGLRHMDRLPKRTSCVRPVERLAPPQVERWEERTPGFRLTREGRLCGCARAGVRLENLRLRYVS